MPSLFLSLFSAFIFFALVTASYGAQKMTVIPQPDGDKVTYGVYLEPKHHVQKRAMDQPIRISVSYDSSVNIQLMDDIRLKIKGIIDKILVYLSNTLKVKPTGTPIQLDRTCVGNRFRFQNDPQSYCDVSGCASVTSCGQLAVIPDSHLKACRRCTTNFKNSCGTIGSDGAGVSDTDFILYVTAVSTAPCSSGGSGTVAFASHCQTEQSLDRPIAGFVNFCPAVFTSGTANDAFAFDVAKHEILHALGFSSSLYPFWRDGNGNPRTPRDSFNTPPLSPDRTRFLWSTDTIREVTYTDWQTRSGPVSHTVSLLVTPNVVAAARDHFDCQSLEGVELENQGGDGTAISHWEKRILGNEAMTGVFTTNAVFSTLTLALLEDSGWYQVNYDMAEPLVWGRGAGCEFVTGSCGEWITTRTASSLPLTPFCNTQGTKSCTVDYKSVSFCNLVSYETAFDSEYQYFSDPSLGGGVPVADYCPFQQANGGVTCEDGAITNGVNIFAETYGSGSRCVEHGRTWSVGQQASVNIAAGCYVVYCVNATDTTNGVIVNVLGQNFTCSSEGEEIMVDVTFDGSRHQGSIICPPLIICEVPVSGSRATPMTGGTGPTEPSGATQTTPIIESTLLLILFGAALIK